jgi:hypothetical protein
MPVIPARARLAERAVPMPVAMPGRPHVQCPATPRLDPVPAPIPVRDRIPAIGPIPDPVQVIGRTPATDPIPHRTPAIDQTPGIVRIPHQVQAIGRIPVTDQVMGQEEDLVAGSSEIDPVGSEEVTGREEGLAIVPPSAGSAEAIVPAVPAQVHAPPLRGSAVIDRALHRLQVNVLP